MLSILTVLVFSIDGEDGIRSNSPMRPVGLYLNIDIGAVSF